VYFIGAKAAEKNGRDTRIDMTDKMFNEARRNAQKYSYKNSRFGQVDIEKEYILRTTVKM
jgi:ubiquinone/menaquinone biosynthesis C-methylase UbiE